VYDLVFSGPGKCGGSILRAIPTSHSEHSVQGGKLVPINTQGPLVFLTLQSRHARPEAIAEIARLVRSLEISHHVGFIVPQPRRHRSGLAELLKVRIASHICVSPKAARSDPLRPWHAVFLCSDEVRSYANATSVAQVDPLIHRGYEVSTDMSDSDNTIVSRHETQAFDFIAPDAHLRDITFQAVTASALCALYFIYNLDVFEDCGREKHDTQEENTVPVVDIATDRIHCVWT
jgi:hypothetical protein